MDESEKPKRIALRFTDAEELMLLVETDWYNVRYIINDKLTISTSSRGNFYLDKRGINVILKTDDAKKLSYDLRHELVLDSHGMITKCPNYNRLKEKAVAIEIKNLDISCLNKDNLDEIVEIIKKYQ